jgi:hypothetical protein
MKKLHPTVTSLLAEIEDFCRLTKTNPTQFGLRVMHDSHFVGRLKSGRSPELETIDRVRNYMKRKTIAAKPFNGKPCVK